MSGVGAQFAAIAEGIERGDDSAALPKLMEQAHAACGRAAASTEVRQSLQQVQQALQAWKEVWPRMGRQREFRMAVAREARLWAKRFESV